MVEAIVVQWTHCLLQETSLRWFQLCQMTVVKKGWRGSATTLREGWSICKGPKSVARKSPHSIYTKQQQQQQQPGPLTQVRIEIFPCFSCCWPQIPILKSKTCQTRPRFSNLLVRSLSRTRCGLLLLLPQGATCRILHCLVVTSGYLQGCESLGVPWFDSILILRVTIPLKIDLPLFNSILDSK